MKLATQRLVFFALGFACAMAVHFYVQATTAPVTIAIVEPSDADMMQEVLRRLGE